MTPDLESPRMYVARWIFYRAAEYFDFPSPYAPLSVLVGKHLNSELAEPH